MLRVKSALPSGSMKTFSMSRLLVRNLGGTLRLGDTLI